MTCWGRARRVSLYPKRSRVPRVRPGFGDPSGPLTRGDDPAHLRRAVMLTSEAIDAIESEQQRLIRVYLVRYGLALSATESRMARHHAAQPACQVVPIAKRKRRVHAWVSKPGCSFHESITFHELQQRVKAKSA